MGDSDRRGQFWRAAGGVKQDEVSGKLNFAGLELKVQDFCMSCRAFVPNALADFSALSDSVCVPVAR